MNLNSTIIPKSDQLNADDLIAGPRTIKITAVESGSAEQPVMIQYEGGKGRPYKPSKSMRRVLIVAWGSEGNAYTGRSLTIYRDPTVKFGGEATGGIKISHMSDIPEALSISLTETRGKRKPHRVEPLSPGSGDTQLDAQTLSDIGDTKAKAGAVALREWWESVPKGPAKTSLAAKLIEWKRIAADADAQKAAA